MPLVVLWDQERDLRRASHERLRLELDLLRRRILFRVLAHWPRDRYLDLAPKYWARTRARLDPAELAAEIGPLTVPPPLPISSGEQVAAD